MADKVFSGDDEFWAKYQKGRPQIPDSFFERIFDYHSRHGGHFDTAHDAGSGGGVHSARLANRFEKVLLTDVSSANIEVAKSQLHGSYDFKVAKLEDTIELPAASVDLVFASAMLHFVDPERALAAVAHQLKPGGTFAASLQGMLVFDDATVNEKYIAFQNKGIEEIHKKIGEETVPIVLVQASGYDSFPLPETYFQPGGLRLRLNETPKSSVESGTWYKLMMPRSWREEFSVVSRISPTERIVFEDDDDWLFRGDVNAVRQLLETTPFDLETEEMKRCWQELADAVGKGPIDGRWVVCLILATRK